MENDKEMSEEDKKVTQSVDESIDTGNEERNKKLSGETAEAVSKEEPDAGSEEATELVEGDNPEAVTESKPGSEVNDRQDAVAEENPDAKSEETPELVEKGNSEAVTEINPGSEANNNQDAVVEENPDAKSEETPELVEKGNPESVTEAKPSPEAENIQEVVSEENPDAKSEETPELVEKGNTEAVSEAKPEPTTKLGSDAEKASDQEASEDESQDEDNTEGEDESPDFSEYSKKQLLQEVKEVLKDENLIKHERKVSDLKGIFEETYQKEKEAALEQFIADGGSADDFAYRGDDLDKEFFSTIHDFKERRGKQVREIERNKERNAIAKNQLLDRLRELVDSEETTSSIDGVKAIQEEWKSIGPVPGNQNKNLWASFNALMDRYYDNRSIYFELKELDRKKNLEHKLELCEKAEALVELEDLKEAIKSLNDLHEEFKHLGPVPREEQEKVWQRFKSASDAVYSRRKEFYDDQKVALKVNLDLKLSLIEKLDTFKDFRAERIKDWNAKTKEMLAIQKEWETIGPVPRENGREINRTFWGLFKQFFNHKNHFFKELDEVRKQNKDKAEALIAEAERLKDSTDWKNTANDLIGLQKEWKELGPMPEKIRDDLYHRFKAACDAFFQSRRNTNKEANQEFDDNLKQKESICKQIVSEANAGKDLSTDRLEEFIRSYNEIGFVPRKNIKDIAAKFSSAVDEYVKHLGVEGQDKEEFLFRLNLNKIQTDPNGARVLNKKEHGIRKQIADLENNITLWKNNMEFFAASKTADKLKDQFEEKIDKAEQEVDRLKKKLSIIREF